MRAYKAFKPDLICISGSNKYQYRKGIINREREANCVKNGMHCAENPLDCLSYYSWQGNVFYLVEAGIFHEQYMYCADINTDKDGERVAGRFFGDEWKRKTCHLITEKKESYDRQKRWDAQERKQKRIDEQMDQVGTLPDAFEGWVFRAVFPKRYLFRTADGWYCTSCRKEHGFGKLKHNQTAVCPETQEIVIAKTRQRAVVLRERCMVLQNVDSKQSVARHFTLELLCGRADTGGYTILNVMEEIRILMEKTEGRKAKVYYGQRHRGDEFGQEWGERNPWQKHCYNEFCYPEGVEDALKGTRYEKLAIRQMAEKGWRLRYNMLMINYPCGDIFEYLVKLGLEKLASDEAERMGIGGYYGSLRVRGNRADEVLGINMQRVFRLRKANGGRRYLKWLQWEEKNGTYIPDETFEWLKCKNLYPSDLKFILDRMSPTKVMNYLERQMKETKKKKDELLLLWEDYLSMAKRLGMDGKDEIVYRPKDLIRRHDDLVEEVNRRANDLAAEEMRKKFPLVDAACRRLKAVYEWHGTSHSVLVPDGIADIMKESRQLHHCAGGSERYYERIQTDETYILFLRRNADLDKSWYTLEVEPGGTIRQKRAEYNRQPDLEEAMAAIREWQEAIRSCLKEEEKRKAEESRKKRIEEMEKLEHSEVQRERDLFKLLMNDLSEAG